MPFPTAVPPATTGGRFRLDSGGTLVDLGPVTRALAQTVRHDRTPFSPPGSNSWFTHGTGRRVPLPVTVALTVTGPDESTAIDEVRAIIASARDATALVAIDDDAALVGSLVLGTTPLGETHRLPLLSLANVRYAPANGRTTVWRLALALQPARAYWTDATGAGEHLVS